MATAGVAEAAREADIQADLETASADALRLNVPLKVLRPNNPAVASLYPRRLTLIRPDQHVAWAGEGWPSWEEFDVFLMATGRLPCLSRVEQAAVSSSSTAVTALQVRP